jgi:heme-degrading monooxygenase HmoA
MYTRILTFRGVTDIDGGVTYLREQALSVVTAQNGYRGVSASANRSTNVFGIMSLWETEADRAASESALSKERQAVLDIVGGELTVENLEEVAVQTTKPITPGCKLVVTRVSMDPASVEANVAFFKSDVLPVISSQPGFCALRNMLDRRAGRGVVGSVWESQEALDGFLAIQPERRAVAEQRGVRFDEIETREILVAEIK